MASPVSNGCKLNRAKSVNPKRKYGNTEVTRRIAKGRLVP